MSVFSSISYQYYYYHTDETSWWSAMEKEKVDFSPKNGKGI